MAEQFVSTIGIPGAVDPSAAADALARHQAAVARHQAVINFFAPDYQSFQDRRDQRLEQLRAPPGAEEEEASICWGKPLTFPQSATNPDNSDPEKFGTRIINRKPTDPPKDPDQDKTITLTEKRRKVEKIKVTAQDDKEVFVVVERMLEWRAAGSDGQSYLLKFDPKGPKDVVAKGGSSS